MHSTHLANNSMKKIIYCLLICLLSLPFVANAQLLNGNVSMKEPSSGKQMAAEQTRAEASTDSVVVSLLTCTPGSLVYELYGHTAIRVKEVGRRQSD